MKLKKIFITGGAGFIGSHTCEQLLKKDIKQLTIFDNFTRGSKKNLQKIIKDKRVKIINKANILNLKKLSSSMQGHDVVIHLAALWLLHCEKFPNQAFSVNVKGTMNVLEASRVNNIKKIVYASSASVYGDAEFIPMTEKHPFNNKNFYGSTKIASETLIKSFCEKRSIKYTMLRYMNVYGERQDTKGAYIAVIVKWLKNIKLKKNLEINGTGKECFDFIHVKDCARANVKAVENFNCNGEFNVGTGIGTSLEKLAKNLIKISHSNNLKIIKKNKSLNSNLVTKRIGCTKKSKKFLKFKSKINLESGLRYFTKYFLGNN
jgi:UDP-glucose 4-epimerase